MIFLAYWHLTHWIPVYALWTDLDRRSSHLWEAMWPHWPCSQMERKPLDVTFWNCHRMKMCIEWVDQHRFLTCFLHWSWEPFAVCVETLCFGCQMDSEWISRRAGWNVPLSSLQHYLGKLIVSDIIIFISSRIFLKHGNRQDTRIFGERNKRNNWPQISGSV